MVKSTSEVGGLRTEVAIHDQEPKMESHRPKDGSCTVQASESYGGSDEAQVLADRSKNRRETMEVSDGDEQHEEKDEFETYPAGWKLAAIVVGLCLACILVALDNTIMATAIPKITEQFNSLDDVGWYGSAFLLTTCSVSLLYGKLYTFFSIKWVYLAALGLFELGSLLCGITPNSVGLIIGRAIAGVGAGGIFSGSMLIIAQSAPIRQRPIFTGILTAIYGIAGIAGPLIGGALTDRVSWRWCFYINLPLGGLTCLFLLFLYEAKKPVKAATGLQDIIMQLDPLGLLFFLPAMICLLLALQYGGTKFPWDSREVIALFVIFGVLLTVFLISQWWRQDRATIPPRLIMNRNVWGGSVFVFCLSASFMVYTYYLPIWFQNVKGVSATKSGILNLPMLLGTTICSVLAGGIVSAFGYYLPFVYFATIVTTVAGGLLTTLQAESGHSKFLGYQALYGIGLGAGMSQPLMAVQAAVARADMPSATVIVMFMQSLGGAVFVSAAQNLFHNRLSEKLTEIPGVDASKVMEAGATMIRSVVSKEALPKVLEAYSSAITYAFYIAVAFSGLSLFGALPMQWLSLNKKKT
ncbi:MFS-type transporter [Penicillium ucsense]|uniref:MFS-type transporter n=1 Tax=Penicillium ucsense TaxID=2839758 RepID=A0A8J8W4G6_9EURO|nr:MFS-type transporter [Penicillium ucsense]KAF7733926.1 MFS-type transporter [Penicillium ucsense]